MWPVKMWATALVAVFVIIYTRQSCADYYTSTSVLEDLLVAEELTLGHFEDYLEEEEAKLNVIKSFLEKIEAEMKLAEKNKTHYYENPINAVKIIKRLTRDWWVMYGETLDKASGEAYLNELEKLKLEYNKPQHDDVKGAALGISRLQATYKLETSDVANGILMGKKLSDEMRAVDCFVLGKMLLDSQELDNAASWLNVARQKLNQSMNDPTTQLTQADILEKHIKTNLAKATLGRGNLKLALLMAKDVSSKHPNDTEVIALVTNITVAMQEHQFQLANLALNIGQAEVAENSATDALELPYNKEKYEKICRGELKQTPAQQRNLRCRYVNNSVPFCFIAPFKMEELNPDPYVAYYHEVIYEEEIKGIIKETEDKIERSKVGTLGESQFSEVRTSQNTCLDFEKHDFLKNVKQRLMDITGLSMESAEFLQVANYGIGGHYGPHYDFSEKENYTYEGKGNRILTALFYINNVEMGGATAFPFLSLAVPPIRRSLLVWHNLHESLELDYRTRHAGCPVLKGSKWICNEWFHTVGQEFKRPCGLQQDGYKSIALKDVL